jgi:peptidoglycan/LPS O-acetylase OafA/YrhL
MNVPQPSHSPRFVFLDAMRGLAILGVLSTHCAWFAGGDFRGRPFAFAGMYGVQLFFVVSAFTIFMTLERAVPREPALIRSFFTRRIFRIVPMFWVGIVLYAFAPGREHYYTHFDIGPSYYALTALLQHIWHPYYINSVVPGGWTVGVEMAFYIIAPLIFFRVKSWQAALYFLLATLLICEAASYALRHAVAHQMVFKAVQADQPELMQQFYFKWFPSQLPVFACGILGYYVFKAMPAGFHNRRNGFLLLATASMALYNAVDIGGHRLLPEQAVYGLGFLLLVLSQAVYPFPLFVNPAVCFLGRISFSFYLLHFVIMDAEIRLFHAFLPGVYSRPALAYVALAAATLVITIPLAWLTYTCVEQPFIKLGSNIVRRLNSAPELAPKTAGALTSSDS